MRMGHEIGQRVTSESMRTQCGRRALRRAALAAIASLAVVSSSAMAADTVIESLEGNGFDYPGDAPNLVYQTGATQGVTDGSFSLHVSADQTWWNALGYIDVPAAALQSNQVLKFDDKVRFGGYSVSEADDFAYTDPVDGSVTEHQGIRVEFAEGARIVYRLSGTGTEGATLRVYLERFEPDPARHAVASDAALAPLAAAAGALADIEGILGRSRPSVVA